jgi:hypothetical protein
MYMFVYIVVKDESNTLILGFEHWILPLNFVLKVSKCEHFFILK